MQLFSRIRLPSFTLACALCIASLVAFTVWAFMDALFGQFWQLLRIDLRLDAGPAIWWSAMIIRWWILTSLVIAWSISIGVLFYRLLAGTVRDRSIIAMFVVLTLLAVTIGLVVEAAEIHASGFASRIARILPQLKQDAAVLQDDWPKEQGELPYCGHFVIGDSAQFVLSVFPPEGIQESFACIQWLENVGIAFESSTHFGTFVENHLPGRKPSSRRRNNAVFDQFTLLNYREIEPNWYIVEYRLESSSDDVSEAP